MCAYLLVFVAALLSPTLPQDAGAGQDIPVLEPVGVVEILIFEIDGLTEAEIEIERIKRLHDRAKAYVKIRDRGFVVSLRCRRTDFGPRWGLAGDPADSVIELDLAVEPPAPPLTITPSEAEREGEPAASAVDAGDRQEPSEGSTAYQLFLTEFVSSLRKGLDERYAGYNFRDADFDLEGTDKPLAEALADIRSHRELFVKRCQELSRDLSSYDSCSVVSVVATGMPSSLMAEVRAIMPTAEEFYSTVVVTLDLDGREGTITLEGVTLLEGSWRIGAVAVYSLPPAAGPEQ